MKEQEIKDFIEKNKWIFAKTYAKTSPHEYIVRGKVLGNFDDFVIAIRENGKKGYFYKTQYIYLEFGDFYYWTMGNPVSETKIINRASKELYELKEYNGKLYMMKKQ